MPFNKVLNLLFILGRLTETKLVRQIVVILLAFGAFSFFAILSPDQKVDAAQLLGGSDYTTDDTPLAPNVQHNISFVLPDSGASLGLTDYVIIDFPNYTDVSIPTSSSGWSGGSPIYTISGTRVLITNVTADLGNGIGISGVTATNPANGQPREITVQIGDDTIPTSLYHDTVISPTNYKSITTVSVVVTTQIASIEFNGFTSPNAFVTITLDGSIVGTTTANSAGNFTKYITGLEPNLVYDVGIFSEDTSGRRSQTVNFTAMTLSGVYVVVGDIAIPTTIQVDPRVIFQGDATIIKGRGHPYSQVTLFIEGSNSYSFVVTANSSGYWSHTLNTLNYPLNAGSHQAFAREVVSGGYTSVLTQPEAFTVNRCRIADLNCDDHVNLTDFSIMMFFWETRNPSNHRADINDDTYVNLTDFSLLLFYWTG